jgi:hypothetical protein
LGERLLCKQEVIGSIPFTSTIGQSPDESAWTRVSIWPLGQAVSIFNNSEEAKRISANVSAALMTGCDCIQTLSKLENGNAVAP